ncbi:hypothetical protein P9209_16300 [Prescottella defluvii]|nr:hypothetical protein P9209_16300 [Prescottella defluvii]
MVGAAALIGETVWRVHGAELMQSSSAGRLKGRDRRTVPHPSNPLDAARVGRGWILVWWLALPHSELERRRIIPGGTVARRTQVRETGISAPTAGGRGMRKRDHAFHAAVLMLFVPLSALGAVLVVTIARSAGLTLIGIGAAGVIAMRVAPSNPEPPPNGPSHAPEN